MNHLAGEKSILGEHQAKSKFALSPRPREELALAMSKKSERVLRNRRKHIVILEKIRRFHKDRT